MRSQSVGNIKNKTCSHSQPIPREGSKIREVYDLFYANKGVAIEWHFSGSNRLILDLQDYYGLDIRNLQKGSPRTGRPSKWVLAGEWFGKTYVDYIATKGNTE